MFKKLTVLNYMYIFIYNCIILKINITNKYNFKLNLNSFGQQK